MAQVAIMELGSGHQDEALTCEISAELIRE